MTMTSLLSFWVQTVTEICTLVGVSSADGGEHTI